MNAHRVETVISQDRAVIIKDSPFRVGELVEVIILQCPPKRSENEQHPLRGMPITYISPTEPVAQEDWRAVR
ncbi:MAG: hypothetical protein OXN17_04565 [Candidatus Poribacteria bacterium]|nr:hypothetical protein [Candidatus Poribacteria bacterium]